MAKKYKSGVEPGGILHRPAGIEHPEKVNRVPRPKGKYPSGHETTRCEMGAKSAWPKKEVKGIRAAIQRQVGGNSDPKKRG